MTTSNWGRQRVATPDHDNLCMWYPHGVGPVQLHFAHATGFHAHTYAPLFAELTDVPMAAWDMRGHGHSADGQPRPRLQSWSLYAADLEHWLLAQEHPVWLAGHSVGATVSAMVALRQPQRVRGLILIEPVLLGPLQSSYLWWSRQCRKPPYIPIAAGAARRRPAFSGPDQARAAYQGRGAFKTWPQHWLDAYVDHALIAGDEEWRLRCHPAFESSSFDATPLWPTRWLKRVQCPVVVHLGAVQSSTTGAYLRRWMRRHWRHQVIQTWEQQSHFLPMEATTLLAQSMRQTLRDSMA
jgi:pimeloyl-ACP methyl ester carboxylesterase